MNSTDMYKYTRQEIEASEGVKYDYVIKDYEYGLYYVKDVSTDRMLFEWRARKSDEMSVKGMPGWGPHREPMCITGLYQDDGSNEWLEKLAEDAVKNCYIGDKQRAEEAERLKQEQEAAGKITAEAVKAAIEPLVMPMTQMMAMAAPMSFNAPITMSAPVSNEVEKYLLNTPKTTYHRISCDKAKTGSLQTIEDLKKEFPSASPCATCNPPALS